MPRSNTNTVTRVFGFAVRERDWPLAGLLALAMGREPALVDGARSELAHVTAGNDRVSFGSLRALGYLLRAIARLDSKRG